LDAKGRLKRGVLVQLVENAFGLRAALEFNDDAHPCTVGLIAHVRNSVKPTFAVESRDTFDQAGFVQLVRYLLDDDGKTSVADLFDRGSAAHGKVTASGAVSLANALTAHNNAAGGEVRSGNELHQVFHADLVKLVKTVDEQIEGSHQFAQIVRGNVGSHANRDAVGTVHQQVGSACWQNLRFLERAVKVVEKVNRVFIQVGKDLVRNLR